MYTKPLPRTDQRRVVGYENIAAYQAAISFLVFNSYVVIWYWVQEIKTANSAHIATGTRPFSDLLEGLRDEARDLHG